MQGMFKDWQSGQHDRETINEEESLEIEIEEVIKNRIKFLHLGIKSRLQIWYLSSDAY